MIDTCVHLCLCGSKYRNWVKANWPRAANPWSEWRKRHRNLWDFAALFPWQINVWNYPHYKIFFYKKKVYIVVCTPRKSPWVAWGCVWPTDILCLNCGLFKNVISFFIQHLKIRLHIRISISDLSWKLRKIWKLRAIATDPGAAPRADSPILACTDLCSLPG